MAGGPNVAGLVEDDAISVILEVIGEISWCIDWGLSEFVKGGEIDRFGLSFVGGTVELWGEGGTNLPDLVAQISCSGTCFIELSAQWRTETDGKSAGVHRVDWLRSGFDFVGEPMFEHAGVPNSQYNVKNVTVPIAVTHLRLPLYIKMNSVHLFSISFLRLCIVRKNPINHR